MKDKTNTDKGQVIIIVNSIRPYAYEVNNILALPNGFTYRFRFRRAWMPTIENPIDLVNRNGLAVLRDFDTAKFVPLRRIRIINIREVGEVSYIEYTLEDIIDLDSEETVRNEQLKKFNEHISVAISGFENVPDHDLKNLIFMSSDLAYGIKDKHYNGDELNRAFNSWGNLIQVLGQIECFTDVDFLKVVQIADSKGQAVPVAVYPYPNKARFHLKNNVTYRMDVFQRTFTHQKEGDSAVVSSRQAILSSESGEVRIIRSTHSVVGKYDLYPFSFNTTSESRPRDMSLSLQVTRGDNIIVPGIDIPVRILVSRMQKFVRVISLVCFVIGVILLFGADPIGTQVGLTPAMSKIIERFGIFMAIMGSYGLGPFAKSVTQRMKI